MTNINIIADKQPNEIAKLRVNFQSPIVSPHKSSQYFIVRSLIVGTNCNYKNYYSQTTQCNS